MLPWQSTLLNQAGERLREQAKAERETQEQKLTELRGTVELLRRHDQRLAMSGINWRLYPEAFMVR